MLDIRMCHLCLGYLLHGLKVESKLIQYVFYRIDSVSRIPHRHKKGRH